MNNLTTAASDTAATHVTPSSLTDTTEPTATDTAQQDPAGGIRLSGRNRMCIRARALAGMVLTSGIVVALGTTDTTSSMQHTFHG